MLEAGGLHDVTVRTVATPMQATSLAAWWERVPMLAGPLALALAGMEAEVRDAIADRATRSGAKVATSDAEGIVFAGSSLIASGRKPTG